MNKKGNILVIIACVILIWFTLGIINFIFNPRSSGKDTVLSLGDGTFQILRGYLTETEDAFNLTNVVNNETITNIVIKYKIIKKQHKIFVIGKHQPGDIEYRYTILNYKTGEHASYYDLDELNSKDRAIFDDQDSFEWPD